MTTAEIAHRAVHGPKGSPLCKPHNPCAICPPVTTALEDARREALEEAAKAVCSGCEVEYPLVNNLHMDEGGAGTDCRAFFIRALLEKP